MFYTYVLYSEAFDRIYIGQTANIKYRFERHNDGLVRSTKAYKPWELIHFELFESRTESMRRERALKSHQGREFIRGLLSIGRVRQLRIED